MPAITTMFTISSSDQSQAYLAYLFGTVGNVLSPTSGSTTLNIMGTMFKVLNMTALTVGVLIVIYTTIMGVIATAHEGEALGKKWSGLWVPIRMVVGVIFLFPAQTGYSVLQIFLMWIILQGVGAADTLWSTVLNYINLTGSPYATVTIPSIGVQQQIENLFQDLTCQATAALNTNSGITNPSNNGNKLYYCEANSGGSGCGQAAQLPDSGNTTYNMGPTIEGAATCGTMSYYQYSDGTACSTDTTTISGVVCNAQVQALSSIVTTLGGVASQFAAADQAYQQFYASAQPPTGNSQFVQLYCNATSGLTGAGACCVQTPQMQAQYALDEAAYKSQLAVYQATHLGTKPTPPTLQCSPNFPAASGSDITNSSTSAVTNLLWPYDIKPLVMVNGNSQASANFITSAVNVYIATITNAVMNYYINQNSQSGMPSWMQQAQQLGWILAGGYYYQMATMSGGNNTNSFQLPVLTVTANDPSNQANNNPLINYRNNYSVAGTLVSLVTSSGQAPTTTSTSSAPGMSSISDYSNGVSGGIMSAFMNMLTGGSSSALNSSPLVKLVAFGHGMMITGDVIFEVFLLVMLGLLVSLGWEPFVLGTGLHTPLGNLSVGMALIFTPIVMAILGFVYSIGGLLGVYTPLIPYIIFTLGAVGWLIAVIEAMAAAPFIALGILSPGEHHGMLGKAEPALMAMLNIFLRPSLMVFAMMASMLLSSVAVALVNAAFANVVNAISPTYGSFVEPFIFIAAYTSLILSVLNKSFALIHIIPDGVLKWIGVHHAPGGGTETGQEALQGAKEKTSAAASAAGSAAGGAVGAGMGKATGDAQKKAQQKQTEAREDERAKEKAQKKRGGSGRINPNDANSG